MPDGVNAGSLVANWLELKEKTSISLVETSHETQFTGVMIPVADSTRIEKWKSKEQINEWSRWQTDGEWKKSRQNEKIQERRPLSSLCQLRNEPAGVMQMSELQPVKKSKFSSSTCLRSPSVESLHALLFISRHHLWLLAIFSESREGNILERRQAARRGAVLALQLTLKALPIPADGQSPTEEWMGCKIAYGKALSF